MESQVVFNLKENVHVLIRDPNGDPYEDTDTGKWLILDTIKNQMIFVTPNDIIKAFFKVVQPSREPSAVNDKVYEQEEIISDLMQPSTSAGVNEKNYDFYHQDDIVPNDSPESVTEKVRVSAKEKWDRKAILGLINEYKENIPNFKNTAIKNEKVWQFISNAMNDLGYNYTNKQCEWKFGYLKNRYVKKKDNMGSKSTGESPIKFEFFDEFEEMFGEKPNLHPISKASSIKGCEVNTSDSENSLEAPPPKKTRMEKDISNIMVHLQDKDIAKEKERERRHKEKQALLQLGIETHKELMNKLIDKLL